MYRLPLSIIILLVLSGPVTAARPFTVDDMLRMESIGAVQVSPDGKHVVFERSGPYEDSADFGRLQWPDRKDSARIYIMDMKGMPQLLFEQAAGEGHWLGRFSPSGERLIVYQATAEGVKACVYGFKSGRRHCLKETPNVDFTLPDPVLWLTDDTLVYATVPAGEWPALFDFRTGPPERLAANWRKAWRGRQTTASPAYSGDARAGGPSSPKGRLVRVNLKSGAEQMMGEGRYVSLTLSPDGRRLAALKKGAEIQPRPEWTISGIYFHGNWRSHLEIFDLDQGGLGTETSPCAACDVFPGTVQWAPDSSKLVLFARAEDHFWDKGKLMRFVLGTRKLTSVRHEGLRLMPDGMMPRPHAVVWWGDKLAIFAHPAGAGDETLTLPSARDGSRADWYLVEDGEVSVNLTKDFTGPSIRPVAADRNNLYFLSNGNIWRLREGGRRENLTGDIPAPVTVWQRPLAGYFYRAPLSETHLLLKVSGKDRAFLLQLDTGTRKRLDVLPDSRLAAMLFAAETVILRQDSDRGSSLFLAQVDRPLTPLIRVNQHLMTLSPSLWKKIEYQTSFGETLFSWALLPPDWKADRRYPMVVHIYPTAWSALRPPSSEQIGVFQPNNMQLLAAKGYVVLFPSLPDKLTRREEGPLLNVAEAVMPAVEQAVTDGYGDPDRLGLFGYSYGGIAALTLLTKTGRFKAAIVGASAANLGSYYGGMSLPDRIQAGVQMGLSGVMRLEEKAGAPLALGVRPWELPERYIQNSPLFQADRITTPLMLIHGNLDYHYPISQFDEMFTALYRLNREAVFVRYWGEGHGIFSPANIRDMWDRQLNWLERHLGNPEAAPAKVLRKRRPDAEDHHEAPARQ